MKDQELDNLFRNKLESIKREPSANAFDKIQNKLQKPEKKSGLWLYMKVAAAILLLISLSVVLYKTDVFEGSNNIPVANNETQPTQEQKDASDYKLEEQPLLAESEATKAEEEAVDSQQTESSVTTVNNEEKPDESTDNQEIKRRSKKVQPQQTAPITAEMEEHFAHNNVEEAKEIEKISEPHATTETAVASNEQKEKEAGQTFTFDIEDFDKKAVASATTETTEKEDKSALKKVLNFAKNLKESDGLGELRDAKNELFAFNSKKMTTQNKTTTLKLAMLMLGMLFAFPTLAQQKTDSLIINVGKSKIIFLVKDKQDLETLRNYDLNAILEKLSLKLENDSTHEASLVKDENGEKTYLNDTTIVVNEAPEIAVAPDVNIDSVNIENTQSSYDDNDHEEEKEYGTTHYFNLELGTNNYLTDGSFPDETNAPYTVRPWGSWYVALTSVNKTHVGGPLYLEWGPSVSWYNFKFQNDNMRIYDNDDGVEFIEDTEYPDADFKKSKLTATYINFTAVPTLSFGNKHSRGTKFHGVFKSEEEKTNSGFRIGAGAYVGYRIDSYSKIVFTDSGDDDKEKKRHHDDYNLNNFRYGLRFQLGYRDTDVFINYDLNELFIEGQGPKLNAISFGVIF